MSFMAFYLSMNVHGSNPHTDPLEFSLRLKQEGEDDKTKKERKPPTTEMSRHENQQTKKRPQKAKMKR